MSGDSYSSDRSVQSGRSSPRKGLRASGGYRTLRSFRTATIIYDATVSFCERFVDKRSRTTDQMVQAARSGRQNIAEGSRASAASSQTELRLVSVARASLDELLLDYEDFLRQRRLPQWPKESSEAREVRAVGRKRDSSDPSDQTEDASDHARYALYAGWLDHRDPEVVANTIICLIHQANYLLDQQVVALERDFIHEGGYSEKLAAARLQHRRAQQGPGPSTRSASSNQSARSPASPACPHCDQPMVLRTARQGSQAGTQFWGCSTFPTCKATLPL